MPEHEQFMRVALRMARRGYGATSPNPMVGAVLVKKGAILAKGWHRRAGAPHAEIEAIRAAQPKRHSVKGSTLYVTLEPCCTTGRTPPCTEAILAAGIKRVVVGATDPNPLHSGKGFTVLGQAGIEVIPGVAAAECTDLNEAFNHWIVHRTPFVTVKSAMTLDGKIATADGDSKWITGPKAREWAMKLRLGADAILVGINTVLADDPLLTIRGPLASRPKPAGLRRIVLDSQARTPLSSKIVVSDPALTTVFVSAQAPVKRVAALEKKVRVITVPSRKKAVALDLQWILNFLGRENVTSMLVEGGGEINASFLQGGFPHRVALFYAPKILGGSNARKAVSGSGAQNPAEIRKLTALRWKRLGVDWLLQARVS